MTNIVEIIKSRGPILSGELIEIIVNQDNSISKDAARKRISRIKDDDIARVTGLFADRQILFHDKAIFRNHEYYEGLSSALKNAGKQYYLILQSLDFHYGVMNLANLPAYSISPVKLTKGHQDFHTVINKLNDLSLISIQDKQVYLSYAINDNQRNEKKSKGVETAKNFLLIQFNDWARKIGLASYNTSSFHSDFGNFQFNYVNPSYVGTLPKYSSSKKIVPGFVIADILIGNTVNAYQIEFFLNKIKTLKFKKNTPSFLPFLIVESIDTDSLNLLKAEGIIVGFVNELFGSKYKELLNSLINLVTNAGAILKKNPDAYLDLITKLNKLVDGKTNNLRGDLFELAVGYYQGRMGNSIEIGKSINFEGNLREIDVFSFMPNKVTISECKGYNSMIDIVEVDKWLGEKIPIIRKWIMEQAYFNGYEIVFEFWSTGGFTPDARALLEQRKAETKKYQIDFFDIENMMNKSKALHSKKFTDILNEYYIKEI
ncbi:hypothetical protein M0G43_05805 [Subsaxibacter sp. CAU 1640]|uniref:hypothetical protein n=1 Tax=Subsaxibacter sp. CAU 1640 TaxID=2933271 RepID=UPI0020047735|nr:hypothetical protein [Subsaxibacter sp. CAU 1640]MCK7590078.1 hypothetical protein [Subsaxibacter sp. CAU 1640]